MNIEITQETQDKFRLADIQASHYEPIYLSMSREDDMRMIADGIKASMDRFADSLASISGVKCTDAKD